MTDIKVGTRQIMPDKVGTELRCFVKINLFDHEDGIFEEKWGFKYEIRNKRLQFHFSKYTHSVWNGLSWNHIYGNIMQHENGSIHLVKN